MKDQQVFLTFDAMLVFAKSIHDCQAALATAKKQLMEGGVSDCLLFTEVSYLCDQLEALKKHWTPSLYHHPNN